MSSTKLHIRWLESDGTMGERFSAAMDGRLVEIFVDKLRGTLAGAGFVETLRLPSPHVGEFLRDSDVVVVQIEHVQEQRK